MFHVQYERTKVPVVETAVFLIYFFCAHVLQTSTGELHVDYCVRINLGIAIILRTSNTARNYARCTIPRPMTCSMLTNL